MQMHVRATHTRTHHGMRTATIRHYIDCIDVVIHEMILLPAQRSAANQKPVSNFDFELKPSTVVSVKNPKSKIHRSERERATPA
jgi:hypothetical protein